MNSYGLAYDRLSDEEKTIYICILKGLLEYRQKIDLPKSSDKVDLLLLINTILSDNPEIIYFNKTYITTVETVFKKQIILSGCMNRSMIIKMNKELNDSITDAIFEIKKSCKDCNDTWYLIKGIYEYIQRNVKYDKSEQARLLRKGSNRPELHNAYGPLVTGYGVCDGIASAFTIIAKRLGIRSMVVTGKAGEGNEIEDHGWNIVEFEKRFYHLDLTWDVNKYWSQGEYSYEYFGLDDEEISYDHSWVLRLTPRCNGNVLSYYLRNGLYANSKYNLERIIGDNIRRGEKVIRLQLSRDIVLPKDSGKYLSSIFMSIALRYKSQVKITYSWNEANRTFTVKLM